MPPKQRLLEDAKVRVVIGNALEYDYGVAPNISGEVWTNALCRPDMRRSARIGDIIIGFVTHNMAKATTGRENPIKQGYIAYFAKITNIFSHEEYKNFLSTSSISNLQTLKTPHYTNSNEFTKSMLEDKTATNLTGDNIFDCSVYCHAAEGLKGNVQEDYESPFVLCSEDFFYFGDLSWGEEHLKEPDNKKWFNDFVIPLNKNGPGYMKVYFESDATADEFFDRLKTISKKACQLPLDHSGKVIGKPTMDLKAKIMQSTELPMTKKDIEEMKQGVVVKLPIRREPMRSGSAVLTSQGVIRKHREKRPLGKSEALETLDKTLETEKDFPINDEKKDELPSTHSQSSPKLGVP